MHYLALSIQSMSKSKYSGLWKWHMGFALKVAMPNMFYGSSAVQVQPWLNEDWQAPNALCSEWMDNRESCCDAPPSCAWDETHRHLSTPVTQPEIDFACVFVRVTERWIYSSFVDTIYIFIPHIIMQWQQCYSVAASMLSALHLPQTSDEQAGTRVKLRPLAVLSLTRSDTNRYDEKEKLLQERTWS